MIFFYASIILTGLPFIGAFLISLYVKDTLPWMTWATAAPLAVYAIAATFQIMDSLHMLLRPRRPRLSRAVYRRLSRWSNMIGPPTLFMGAFVGFLLINLVGFALERAARLLSGEDHLRILVFVTGVTLLLGGMAAQFVATF